MKRCIDVALALASAAVVLTLAACQAERPTVPTQPAASAERAPAAANPERNAYFGDLHLHTGNSMDAALISLSTPDDAYRYAKGEAISMTTTARGAKDDGQTTRISRPLDFLAVTDHAEYLGLYQELQRQGGPLYDSETAKAFRGNDYGSKRKAYAGVIDDIVRAKARPEFVNDATMKSVWSVYADEAAKHYQPGKFTTFIGFEWTSMPGNWNLHRNVIFGSTVVPDRVFSAFDSEKPEDLWTYLENARKNGSDVVSISHNGNLSGGRMFALTDSYGKPIDADYARRRVANEIAHEIIQVKGASETHPSIAPNDEFAAFESAAFQLGTFKPLVGEELGARTSFLREAYKNGLLLQEKLGVNPFKFGIVASSDSHNGTSQPDEFNFKGVHGIADSTPEARIVKPVEALAYSVGSGGLAGIWAPENTRESLFAALKRNETFGTSGVRIRPRFFGGWNYSPAMLQSKGWLTTAYRDGVPMGGTLPAAQGNAPIFVVSALKDPDGAQLDRIQIIKGWTRDGQAMDKIYDVALSGGRKTDPATGKAPPVGNTVDSKSASYTNTIGAAELSAVWTDPDFDASVPAFYYVRVLEIPTPRWSTYDAAKLGIAPRKDVEVTIQERAWTSPIWYTPVKR
jgi:hypothetical protein